MTKDTPGTVEARLVPGAFAGMAVALRERDGQPIPGEPFVSLASANEVVGRLVASLTELVAIASSDDPGAAHEGALERAKALIEALSADEREGAQS